MSQGTRVHITAEVSNSATVPLSARVWQYSHIRENVALGENVVIGRGVYIGPGVLVGDNCKIQNYALVYEPAVIEEGVFIGPGAVLTNDRLPRAVNTDLSPKTNQDWHQVGVHIGTGASIGANATCIAPLTIGNWALIGSGSVVTKDVPDFALMVGNPAKRIGWVGPAGVPLEPLGDSSKYICPSTGSVFTLREPEKLVRQLL